MLPNTPGASRPPTAGCGAPGAKRFPQKRESIMAQLTIQQAFDLALQHHQAGRLREAEQLYRLILGQQPTHIGAIHFLGVMAYQEGRNDSAIDLIRKAIALRPNYPEAYINLGTAL